MNDLNRDQCLFCEIEGSRIVAENAKAVVIFDAYPVADGHTLVIPRRHVLDIFELPPDDWLSIYDLLRQMRQRLDERHNPDGYNLGINIGRSAGQTVMHAHVHLIPRYKGDVADPTGGVRNVIPEKCRYHP